jgi:chromosome partitioning protein
MTKIISITNNKGGVGKTTTALNLGAALVKLGKKTLLIDLDPQANLTTSFGVDEKNQSHIGHFLLGEKDWQEILIQKQESHGVAFDLLPSSNYLLESEEKLSLRPMREGILSKKLSTLKKDYDFILIDCPPSLGLLTNNALFASDDFIVPIQAEFFAYKGITNLINHILMLSQESEINFLGILLVKYNENMKERLLQGIAQKIREGSQGDKVFQSSIKQDKNLKESPLAGQDVFEYAPESNGAKDYLSLAKEILVQI